MIALSGVRLHSLRTQASRRQVRHHVEPAHDPHRSGWLASWF